MSACWGWLRDGLYLLAWLLLGAALSVLLLRTVGIPLTMLQEAVPAPSPVDADAAQQAEIERLRAELEARRHEPDAAVEQRQAELDAAEREFEVLKQRIAAREQREAEEDRQHISAREAAALLRGRRVETGWTFVRDPGSVAPDYAPTDLTELFTGPGSASGQPVELAGRLHRVLGDDPVLPPGVDPAGVELVLYRYVIFCCAADAIPATAILEGLDAADAPDGEWVRLRGRFYQTGEDGDIPLLKVDGFEVIGEPDAPYLFADPDEFE